LVGNTAEGQATPIEHFNGRSWSIVPSPNSTTGHDEFFGVTPRSDGTAIAVGTATHFLSDPGPVAVS
jgi:hypothetical protein